MMLSSDSLPTYPASHKKRRRATKAEMEERAEFLIDNAAKHRPVTRHLSPQRLRLERLIEESHREGLLALRGAGS